MDALAIPSKHCALCGGDARRTCEDMAGYVEGTVFDVYECQACRTSFIDLKRSLDDEYNVIYGTDPTKDAGYAYYLYLAYAAKQLRNPLTDFGNFSATFWGVVQALNEMALFKGARMLEIGSGLGYLTHALNKAGYECEGLEYSKSAVDFACDFFGETHTIGSIEDFKGSHLGLYDVVIATEVIEHVIDPNAFVADILSTLKPGGSLILTTPIKDIHPEGTIWETEPAPVHLWWFTEKGIESVARKQGAHTSFVDFSPYTARKVWSVHRGTANTPPAAGPVVRADGQPVYPRKVGHKERVMRILPAWLYVKLVCLYHDLRFLQKDKTPTRYMYGMCAVITKA
jgi:SAM-dependent methyltransferase